MSLPLLTVQDLARVYGIKSRQKMHSLIDEWKLKPDYLAAAGRLKLYAAPSIDSDIRANYTIEQGQDEVLARLRTVVGELSAL